MAQLQVENLTEQCLRAISREGLHMGTSGVEAQHPILLILHDICRHINSFGDVEFFGCFVRGVVHGVCWRSLPGGGFLVSPDHKFSGPSVTFLYPDCRWPRKVMLDIWFKACKCVWVCGICDQYQLWYWAKYQVWYCTQYQVWYCAIAYLSVNKNLIRSSTHTNYGVQNLRMPSQRWKWPQEVSLSLFIHRSWLNRVRNWFTSLSGENSNVYNTLVFQKHFAPKARQLEFNVLASDASETFLSFESWLSFPLKGVDFSWITV